jgi:small subunit ribosomal protein S6
MEQVSKVRRRLAAEYDLVLMLDPEAPRERRTEIVDAVRKRIESKGTLKRADDWGVRKMAYEIRHHPEADYKLFQFEADGPLLDELSHSLKIADGVLRFRTVRLEPGMPPPPELTPAPPAAEAPRAAETPPVPEEPSAEPPEVAADEPSPEARATEPAAEVPEPAAEGEASEPAAPG